MKTHNSDQSLNAQIQLKRNSSAATGVSFSSGFALKKIAEQHLFILHVLLILFTGLIVTT